MILTPEIWNRGVKSLDILCRAGQTENLPSDMVQTWEMWKRLNSWENSDWFKLWLKLANNS